jgi:hypothetical protein
MDSVATMATTGVATSVPSTIDPSISRALITPPAQSVLSHPNLPHITNDPIRLSPREIVVDIAGNTLIATQYPAVTTGWWESVLPNGIHTWVSIVFTQTFATTVLDQLGKAQSGSIGLRSNATGTVIMIDRFAEGVQVVNASAVANGAEDEKEWKMWSVILCMLLFGLVVEHVGRDFV